MIKKVLVKKKLVPKKYAFIMDQFYKIMKQVDHREIKFITGQQYELYRKQAEDFVNVMRKIVEAK